MKISNQTIKRNPKSERLETGHCSDFCIVWISDVRILAFHCTVHPKIETNPYLGNLMLQNLVMETRARLPARWANDLLIWSQWWKENSSQTKKTKRNRYVKFKFACKNWLKLVQSTSEIRTSLDFERLTLARFHFSISSSIMRQKLTQLNIEKQKLQSIKK